MSAFSLLHISDWHQKGADFDRDVVLDALLDDIKDRKQIDPRLEKVDLVIFSGDAAYQGRAEEFQRAKEIFFEPVLRACNVSAKHLFMVPGNHDIDRKVVEEFLPPVFATL
jgi:3',5'-cyclic AMP phosphodiesterase CpdA